MARCNLDFSNIQIHGNASDADLKAGLEELRIKVVKDHGLSHFFRQPMSRFPQYQNKVWKWDFAPSGDRSKTRKGWRLFAYVEEPDGPEPILARAFLCYDKSQEIKGNPAKELAEVLKEFLKGTIYVKATPDRFRRQTVTQGIMSLCLECYENVISIDEDLADIAESAHECTKT